MTADWSSDELERIGASDELEIATRRPDGTVRRWLPIWVVCADAQVYVRTWHRRDTGWFGHVVADRRARIRVPGVETEVAVEDLGAGPSGLRSVVDDAYRDKYGRYSGTSVDQMVSDEAAAATLRLVPAGG